MAAKKHRVQIDPHMNVHRAFWDGKMYVKGEVYEVTKTVYEATREFTRHGRVVLVPFEDYDGDEQEEPLDESDNDA